MTGTSHEEERVNIQLDKSEVQEAVAEYLRKRGVVIDSDRQVQMAILNPAGARMDIVGCFPVVVVTDVKLPSEPYR